MWLEATNLHLNYPSRKLASKQQGPFEVSQVLSPLTYHLCLPATWKIHNMEACYPSLPLQETKTNGLNFSKPPPDLIGTKEECEVEWIVSHHGTVGCNRYLTTWKGYPSSKNTLEPKSNLRHTLKILGTYKQTHQLNYVLNHDSMPFTPAHNNTFPIWWSDIPWKLGLTIYQLRYLRLYKLNLDHTPEPTPASSVRSPAAPSTTKITGRGVSSWVPPYVCPWPPQLPTQPPLIPLLWLSSCSLFILLPYWSLLFFFAIFTNIPIPLHMNAISPDHSNLRTSPLAPTWLSHPDLLPSHISHPHPIYPHLSSESKLPKANGSLP